MIRRGTDRSRARLRLINNDEDARQPQHFECAGFRRLRSERINPDLLLSIRGFRQQMDMPHCHATVDGSCKLCKRRNLSEYESDEEIEPYFFAHGALVYRGHRA